MDCADLLSRIVDFLVLEERRNVREVSTMWRAEAERPLWAPLLAQKIGSNPRSPVAKRAGGEANDLEALAWFDSHLTSAELPLGPNEASWEWFARPASV